MYVFEDVDLYLNSLAYTEAYTAQTLENREKLVFTAYETLIRYIPENLVTTAIIATQTMYMIGSQGEGKVVTGLQAKGITSYSIDGVSVSFADGDSSGYMAWWSRYPGISPDILMLLESTLNKKVFVGRLI